MNCFIIDGLNLAYRAHLVNFELKTASGLPSGLSYGFLRTIVSLKKKYPGYKFVLAWDNRSNRKYEILPDYKAGRSGLAPIVYDQIPDLKEMLVCFGVDQYEKEGEEADDVIATLCEKYKSEGHVIVYTNDRDMLQLVEDGKVVVYKPKVGNGQEKFYDESAVKEEYGVPPSKLALFRAFDGDTSDNIKGVMRVPRKLFVMLVNTYGDLDTIYSQMDKHTLSDFQRTSIKEASTRVATNLKLMVLERNIDGLMRKEAGFDKTKLESLLSKYEIKSVKPEDVVSLFSAEAPMVKFSMPAPAYRIESFSLFE